MLAPTTLCSNQPDSTDRDLSAMPSSSHLTFQRRDVFEGVNADPQSLNKYAFGHGDPVQNMDPTGLFSVVGALSGMSIRSTVSSVHNDAALNSLSAAMSASGATNLAEFAEGFYGELQNGMMDSFYSSLPIFGTVYDVFQLGKAALSLLGPTIDLDEMAASGATTAAVTAMRAGMNLPPAVSVLGGQFYAGSRFYTRVRPGMNVDITNLVRTVNGRKLAIPLLGTAQTTGTAGHADQVFSQAARWDVERIPNWW